MTRKCPVDPSEVFDDAAALCILHGVPLTTEDAPAPVVVVPTTDPHRTSWSTAQCWRCGTQSPHAGNVECLSPDCRRSLTPPAMHIRFSGGEIEVQTGGQADLGRQGPHGRVFRDFPNVSRRHAVVGVDDDGRAWIMPRPTDNGTFLNGAEIQDSTNRSLASGDVIRLARDAEGAVTLYDR